MKKHHLIFIFPLILVSHSLKGQKKIEMDGNTKITGKLEIIQAVNDSSIFIGANSGINSDLGLKNTFVGANSGKNNVTGIRNTYLGYNSGFSNITGSANTFLGRKAGYSNTSYSNTFIGHIAGQNNTGFENTILGSQAGVFSTGSGNVFLGAFAGFNESGDNKLYIDNSTSSTPLIYGEFDNDLLRINGKLEINDPVDAQDAATKAYVDLLESTVASLESTVASLEAELEALQGVKDIDNNRYEIVTIGTQTWMAENLKTTRYNDGSIIPLIIGDTDWGNASNNGDPGYCWYDNASSKLITYGALYNWYAIDMSSNGNKNVCPVGWHVPTDAEWTILTTYLGGTSAAGGKMKEAGLGHWNSPNTGATNESGFAGLPGGYRSSIGAFGDIGGSGYWWSSAESDTADAWGRYLLYNDGFVGRGNGSKGSGFSVRCLRD